MSLGVFCFAHSCGYSGAYQKWDVSSTRYRAYTRMTCKSVHPIIFENSAMMFRRQEARDLTPVNAGTERVFTRLMLLMLWQGTLYPQHDPRIEKKATDCRVFNKPRALYYTFCLSGDFLPCSGM